MLELETLKKVLILLGIVILIFCGYGIGSSEAGANIYGE
jgi:hypothetical protein